ncbi:PIN-like domain-containing protein [Sphingomonas sp.]|uniref:PIN-like domain-containing protein n=1 Tax=Sphingomonas sp. TaxID=28214 RepID=UPI002FCA4D16
MKTGFAWYLSASPSAAPDAWRTGTLTVDANVLLDLYRYHTSTCESILSALESFAGRIWISHQAASEFFRHRKKVIASSERMFREASAGLDELEKSLFGGVTKLKGYRLVPRPSLDELSTALLGAVDKARESLAEATAKHPDYLRDDPVLERLFKLFEGRMGAPPSADAKATSLEEAKRRHDERIPPGYMDDEKEGDRRYGDFLLWKEVIDFAKATGKPIILVTSERKEDWWEREGSKTLGPRPELVEEFWKATGQPILLYQTENFLRLANEQAGTGVSEEAVEEIRSLGARRARGRTAHPPAVEVEQLVSVAECDENHGLLEIELLREVHHMTGSGHFEPALDAVPHLTVGVISCPEGCPPLEVTARTGTNFDFNVHVRSGTHGVTLPVGLYRIDYSAVCVDGDVGDTEQLPIETS